MDLFKAIEYAIEADKKTSSIITFGWESLDFSNLEDEQEKIKAFVEANKDFENKPLNGLLVTIKDNIVTKYLRTTAGSLMLEDYIPPYDSFVSHKLKENGAIILGKTTMDEFGFGSFGTNTYIKVARNSIDPSRVAGGSSSGSGAFTGLFNKKFEHVAIAESTGGSISNPAAFNSVIGLTPTYGLVSRYGLIDYANSLDKIGLIGTNVELMAKVLDVISEKDERDETNVGRKVEYSKSIDENRKFKIAILKDIEIIDEKVEKTFNDFVAKLENLGHIIEEIEFGLFDIALASYYIIAMAEASTNLARYGGVLFGKSVNPKGLHYEEFYRESRQYFTEEAKRRILIGTIIRTKGFKGKYYNKALVGRQKVIETFKRIFSNYDLVLTPTMPILPPRFEEIERLSPLEIYSIDKLTVPPNLAGMPHLSYPIGKFIGAQFVADHFREDLLLSIAKQLEREISWQKFH